MIDVSDFNNYRIFLDLVTKDITNLLALGCGEIRAEDTLGAKHILGIEWSDRRLQIAKEKAIVLKYDVKNIADILTDKSFDVVTMFDIFEHLEKKNALKLLEDLHRIVKKQIVIFIPVQPEIKEDNIQIKYQEERKKQNLSMGHHLSSWTPEEFEELGFGIIKYSPNYHVDKKFGALFCIKNL